MRTSWNTKIYNEIIKASKSMSRIDIDKFMSGQVIQGYEYRTENNRRKRRHIDVELPNTDKIILTDPNTDEEFEVWYADIRLTSPVKKNSMIYLIYFESKDEYDAIINRLEEMKSKNYPVQFDYTIYTIPFSSIGVAPWVETI